MSARGETARKVAPQKARRLFAGDAQGRLDEELLDDVAFGLYSRCASLLEAGGLDPAQVAPPRVRGVVQRPAEWEGFVKRQRYTWEITWQDDFEAYHRRPLDAGGDVEVMAYYVSRLPLARSPREKMLLVNRLLYECAHSLRTPAPPDAPPLALRLLQGTRDSVRAALDELFFGSGDSGNDEADGR